MEDATPPPVIAVPAPAPASPPAIDRAAIVQAEPEIKNGASWFWWIAALSLINTVLMHSGSDTSLAIGLGFTLLADVIFKDHLVFALVIDALALITIAGLGWFAHKGHFWAFVLGILLYGLDALIYVFGQDWIAIGIHCFALFYMIRGAARLRTALKAAAAPAPAPVASA